MRSALRRILMFGVPLAILALFFYFAAQWRMQNPLSFRAVALTPGWEGEGILFRNLPEPYTLAYEAKNESHFPVTVYLFASADIYADGRTPDLDQAYLDPMMKGMELTLEPGQVYRGKFQGPASRGKDLWLHYIWEPEIRKRLSPFLLRAHSLCTQWGLTWNVPNSPSSWTKRRKNGLAGPAQIPPSTKVQQP